METPTFTPEQARWITHHLRNLALILKKYHRDLCSSSDGVTTVINRLEDAAREVDESAGVQRRN